MAVSSPLIVCCCALCSIRSTSQHAEVDRLSAEIDEHLAPYEEQISRLMQIPGVGRIAAATIVAEIGTDMVRRIGGRKGAYRKILGLLEKPMRTYLIPA
jgi:hypothetical protein